MTRRRRTVGRVAAACAVLALLALPVAVGGAEPAWQGLADAPTARQEVSFVALDGMLYLAGGNDRAHHRYDPAADAWGAVAQLPAAFEGIDHVHGVAVAGKIAYVGGLTEWAQPFPVVGTVAMYDPDADAFAPGAPMEAPRAAGGVAVWQGMVIYAGGLGPDGSVARVDAYDPDADEWTRLADMPRPRDHFQAVVVGDELYAVGGRETQVDGTSVDLDPIAGVDVLDLPADPAGLASATWREDVTAIPTLRGGHGVAAVGTCIYAIGGEGTPGDPDGVTGATESYDTATGEWRQLASLVTPRHGVQAAVVGKTIHIAAGGTEAFGPAPTDSHEALDVSEDPPCSTGGPGGDPPDDDPPGADQPPSGDLPDPGGSPGAGLELRRFAIRPRLMRVRSGPPRRRGARIELALSEPGLAVLRVQRALRGQLTDGRCVRARRRHRHSSCVAWTPQRGRIVQHVGAGRTVIRFRGRIGGRLLQRGRYRLVLRVGSPAPVGRSFHAEFRVVG